MQLAAPEAAARTEEILEQKRGTTGLHLAASTEIASVDDASEIAQLLDATFDDYPTPMQEAYVAQQIEDGNVFRVVRERGEIVSCASADMVAEAMTAELTDCATRPTHRGRGFMRALLQDLMGDLRGLDYPTAFTLARAAVPGVNIAFQRCGFTLRGQMAQSCRIGDGLEDMNVWSRSLAFG